MISMQAMNRNGFLAALIWAVLMRDGLRGFWRFRSSSILDNQIACRSVNFCLENDNTAHIIIAYKHTRIGRDLGGGLSVQGRLTSEMADRLVDCLPSLAGDDAADP